MLDIDSFASLVFNGVKNGAADANVGFKYDVTVKTYRNGVLTVTVSKHDGAALVSYVAPQTDSSVTVAKHYPFR